MTTAAHTFGTLYIVATPIGNLEDITLRAIRTLREVDLIAAEDTRHSRKLLSHLGISTRLVSYYREKEKERAEKLLEHLKNGQDVALISDAGTPGISDPGAIIVSESLQAGIPVSPIPGPSAITAALSCAGLPQGPFSFFGFPPAKKNQRQKLLKSLVNLEFPIIFYESPHRIESLISDALDIFGNRQAFWARELTKTHEDIQLSSLSQLLKRASNKNRGEFVLIIYPGKQEIAVGENVDELLLWYHDNTDHSLKDVCRKLSSDLGLSRSKIYQKALLIWNK